MTSPRTSIYGKFPYRPNPAWVMTRLPWEMPMDWLNDERGVPLTIAALERMAIVNALDHTGWCASRTAAILGIGRSTLYRKLDEYGIDRSEAAVTEIVATPRSLPPIGGAARRFPPGTFGSPEANEALAQMIRAMRAEAAPGEAPPVVSGPANSC